MTIIIIIIINITTTIRVVFAIPVASSKSERVFSVAGNTVTQKRVSLAREKVEICLIVMSNTNHSGNTIQTIQEIQIFDKYLIFCVFVPFHIQNSFYKVPKWLGLKILLPKHP